jgi:predicted NAD/FAD-binding protein
MSRIAVVGAGVSGLVAARELDLAGHDVVVFEAGARPGGHSNTVAVETPGGVWNVDTGFIVFNDRNYPNFERLLGELGVAWQPAEMSLSVSDGRGGFEWSSNARGVFARPAHIADPRFHRMIADLARFFREARGLVGANGSGPSLGEFLDRGSYSRWFVERLLIPQVSAVWSADPEELGDFPAAFLAEFLANHGALQFLGRPRWHSITGGSRAYVERLAAPLGERLRLRARVQAISRGPGGVELVTRDGRERFDEVVLALHSDQALALLADPSRAEREVLGSIPYVRNEAILHTDASLLPRRRRAWASWNCHLVPEAVGRTTITYYMNRLQDLRADRELLVTLNLRERIDPATVLAEFVYDHPVYTRDALVAQARWAEISGVRDTHYCGAYWRWGFHEDGVWSALRACGGVQRSGGIAPPALARAA